MITNTPLQNVIHRGWKQTKPQKDGKYQTIREEDK
jgi:hypothetical protein